MIKYSDNTYTQSLPTDPRRAAMIVGVYGHVDFKNYLYRLPDDMRVIGGWLTLDGLPSHLQLILDSEDNIINLDGYTHTLPVELTEIAGSLYLGGYKHKLPESLRLIRGNCSVENYDHNLPKELAVYGTISGAAEYTAKVFDRAWELMTGKTINAADSVTEIERTKTLPPWILLPKALYEQQIAIAIYRNNEWKILGDCGYLTVRESLETYREHMHCWNAVKSLIEQIEKSPLK